MSTPPEAINQRAATSGALVPVADILPRALVQFLPPEPLLVGDLSPQERPRDRLRRLGPESLTVAELLSILLVAASDGDASPGLGQQLLAVAGGSLRRLSSECASVLRSVPGVGPGRIAQLIAAFELARRWATESHGVRPRIRCPSDIAAIYAPRLQDLTVEEFHVGILDTQLGLERDVCVARGTLDGVRTHPREIFRTAIESAAAAVVLVHNHPSGDPTPSYADRQLTRELAVTGRTIDIPIHDHIIIGHGCFVSFLEQQLL